MRSMGMVQMPRYDIIDMIAMGNCFVPASWTMSVPTTHLRRTLDGRIGVYGNRMFINVVSVHVMKMTVMKIINMAIMTNCLVATILVMLVWMLRVVFFRAVSHRFNSL